MAYPIERIRSKVNRAKQHIEDFQLRATAFYQTHPYVIRHKEDADRGQRVFYVASLTDIPDTVASIAADAIQNLRSPLDYLANRIETVACGSKPKHQVYFPIGKDAAHYETVRRAYIKCAGKAAIDAFDATEPYEGGRGHALRQLHELNKPDKHDLPLTVAGGYRAVDIMGSLRDSQAARTADIVAYEALGPLFLKPADRMCPLKVGDELFLEPLDVEVKHERKFRFDISFHQPGVIECEPALETLQNFANLVDGIVTAFEPLL
ncbi:MAG: hypothetical protein M3Y88_07080 [Chloroflexota bacterium]|nr:hypothetical protein [Chloroflexota bacterium]